MVGFINMVRMVQKNDRHSVLSRHIYIVIAWHYHISKVVGGYVKIYSGHKKNRFKRWRPLTIHSKHFSYKAIIVEIYMASSIMF